MNPTTNGEAGQIGDAPERWCGDCGDALGDAAHLHDGDLVCPGCWYELRLSEEREHFEEYEAELDSVREEMKATEATFEAEMVELRRQRATWDRRIVQAAARIAAIEEEAEAAGVELAAPAPDPLEGLPPLAGGAPYEPTAEDLAEYRAYCEQLDARRAEEEMDRVEPEAPYGYE
jgi:uncharacterized Zn finger protein (UPF0148 family)